MMDTSPEYIKMCEKAEELRDARHKGSKHHFYLEYGDYVLWNGVRVICSQNYDLIPGIADKIIWLPRQDQLQEMVLDKQKAGEFFPVGVLSVFIWWFNRLEKELEMLTSMEQLWLAFVMKEKYGKVWNGEEWIKEG